MLGDYITFRYILFILFITYVLITFVASGAEAGAVRIVITVSALIGDTLFFILDLGLTVILHSMKEDREVILHRIRKDKETGTEQQ